MRLIWGLVINLAVRLNLILILNERYVVFKEDRAVALEGLEVEFLFVMVLALGAGAVKVERLLEGLGVGVLGGGGVMDGEVPRGEN
jgi:hypothetical protein